MSRVFLVFASVCMHSAAGLLLHPQPGGEEHAEGWGGRRDRHGEGTPWVGPYRHQEGTYCHQGDSSTVFCRYPYLCTIDLYTHILLFDHQGTPERLTMHLVEEHSVVDPTYIEDFLLTYRTFLSSPMVVGKKLLEWFHDPSLRDKVWTAGRRSPRSSSFGLETDFRWDGVKIFTGNN